MLNTGIASTASAVSDIWMHFIFIISFLYLCCSWFHRLQIQNERRSGVHRLLSYQRERERDGLEVS